MSHVEGLQQQLRKNRDLRQYLYYTDYIAESTTLIEYNTFDHTHKWADSHVVYGQFWELQ